MLQGNEGNRNTIMVAGGRDKGAGRKRGKEREDMKG